jgi:tRNA nucleotidyltransferase (CCA-adding enzyme)
VALIEALAERLRVPNALRELAVLAARHHGRVHRALELRPATVLELLEACDAFRRADRFAELLLACEADARGRTGLEERPYPQADYLRRALAVAAGVALSAEERATLSGAAFGERLRLKRLAALKELKEGDADPGERSR